MSQVRNDKMNKKAFHPPFTYYRTRSISNDDLQLQLPVDEKTLTLTVNACPADCRDISLLKKERIFWGLESDPRSEGQEVGWQI